MVKWDPAGYGGSPSRHKLWAMEFAKKLRLDGGESVLDIGSGDGKITSEISLSVPRGHVTGIDNSIDMIEYSKAYYSAKDFPNLEFLLLDVLDMKFERQFDLVYSTSALHWLSGHVPVLERIRKSLKSSGRLYIQMGGKGNMQDLFSSLYKIAGNKKWENYFSSFRFSFGYYGIDEYKKWLAETGFKPLRIELVDKENILEGKEGLAGWIRLALSPYVQRLPVNLQAEFISMIADDYLIGFPPGRDGRCAVKMKRLEVEAVPDQFR